MRAAVYRVSGLRPEKSMAIVARACVEGFRANGWECEEVNLSEPLDQSLDVFVTFGWRRPSRHGCDRTRLIDAAQDAGIPTLCIELGWLSDRSRAEWRHLGWNGLGGRSTYLHGEPGERRNRVFADVKMYPSWIDQDGPALFFGQKPGDAALETCPDYPRWVSKTIEELQKRGERVVFRPHPKAMGVRYRGVGIDTGDMTRSIDASSSTVAWNSSAGVASVLRGIRHHAHDSGSMAYGVDDDREGWFRRIAYSLWHQDEISSGAAIDHMVSLLPCL